MRLNNFLNVHNPSSYSLVLNELFDGALEQPEEYSVNVIVGRFRVFSSIEEALQGLKRGHTLFVQIGGRLLCIDFSKIPLDVSAYDRINHCGCAERALKELSVRGIVTFL